MDLLQTVLSAQNGGAVDQIGRSFGLDQEQTASAIGQLLPALAAGLSRNAAQPGGVDGLMAALAGGSHQRYFDDPASLTEAATIDDGNSILGHILGSKDVSRQVAAQASSRTGIGADMPVLDANKDGSVTDDVMGMLGKFLR